MKRSFLLAIVLLAFNSLFANPVDVNMAKGLGQKFVSANFEQKSSSLELVYTMNTELGEPCFYVFSVSNHGFVIVSADDCAHPILGYSEESAFEADNIAPGLGYMMEIYQEAIEYGKETKATATPEIAAEWKSLENSGFVKPAMRGKSVEPLLTTKWNQSWPYNKFCPEQSASWADHGHVVVGCVATAMAQVMAYWDYPTQGTGSHTYTPVCGDLDQPCYGTPTYPAQTVNFGATTYDWENMVDRIDASSPVEQIDAIATLSYHCGVAVDMMYDHHGTGSGAYSGDVITAIKNYFGYAPTTITRYNQTPAAEWDAMLYESFDRAVPVYYAGSSDEGGGHAFVCDGYDENGLFHFNFGWGGSSDGYFTAAAMEYHNDAQAIFNFVPTEVYNSTAQAPTSLNVTPAANNELSATLTWTNPSKTLNNATLSSIDKIVVERDGKLVAELTGATPGQSMTFVDENVPAFSYYTYSVYAVVNGAHGALTRAENISFGPRCGWTMMLQSSAFQGMRGASVSLYDAAGVEFMNETTTNSSLKTIDIEMPLGDVQFAWNPLSPNQQSYTVTIIVKDPNNETVFNYNGTTDEMSTGVFFTTTNTCGGEVNCAAPTNLNATTEEDAIVLTWESSETPHYGYNIFRDGLLIAMSEETTFTDDDVPFGGHCYTVTALCENGNTTHSNEVCAVLTEGCEPASGLWYEYTSANKIKVYWSAPVNDEGLSGYYVYRKTSEDPEWKRVKVLGANKNDYTDNGANDDNVRYSYKVVAYYQDIDCMSAPAKTKYGNEFSITVSTPTGIDNTQEQAVTVYPNPVDDNLTIEAKDIKNVSVYNLTGQKVYESEVNADEVNLNMSDFQSGMYMIQIETSEYTATKRISVAH
ncbi:MAG: T9SS type A sorting domain-containing protein [Lentimicrobiaceae bacterium]|nr:T9SS type A sorting domain-containing protein [Lentimicrobiaceae bacterium]